MIRSGLRTVRLPAYLTDPLLIDDADASPVAAKDPARKIELAGLLPDLGKGAALVLKPAAAMAAKRAEPQDAPPASAADDDVYLPGAVFTPHRFSYFMLNTFITLPSLNST
jgi:hypothetical protein